MKARMSSTLCNVASSELILLQMNILLQHQEKVIKSTAQQFSNENEDKLPDSANIR